MNNQSISLFELRENVSEIGVELEKAKSLLTFLDDYFRNTEPKAGELLNRYREYGKLFYITDDIICEQTRKIQSLENTLNNISSGASLLVEE